jgi:hypothetical protein
MWLGWRGGIAIDRGTSFVCDQSTEGIRLRNMSAEAVGGVRAAAVLCGAALTITSMNRGLLCRSSREHQLARALAGKNDGVHFVLGVTGHPRMELVDPLIRSAKMLRSI